MAFDDLLLLAKGLIKGWNKEKLEKKIQETAIEALDNRIKNAELEDKIRSLEDEVRRLKGEKAKPVIKKTSTSDLNPSIKKKHKKSSKKDKIEVDEEVEIDVDEDLPKDAKSVGHREVVIQEIVFKRRNIRFRLKRYYSKSLGKVFEGQIPEEFKGREFGPQLISFIMYQFYKNRVTHNKIEKMLFDLGVYVSAGSVSSILNDLNSEFTEDLLSAEKANFKKCSFAHFDETGAKLNGQNYYTFGLSSPYFTKFTTLERKNKESVKEALYSDGKLRGLKHLISDDAPNFKGLVKSHQLCWVHEIRKYKLCKVFQRIESKTLEKLVNIWRGFYKSMKRFRRSPNDDFKRKIENEFDRIVSIRTLVKPLDKQLDLTKKLKENLLLFLKFPHLPLENNQIERDLRERVIKRKISLQNRSMKGVKAWDLMMSLSSTCQKLNLSFWDYLQDRISKREEVPYLGKLVASAI
jgi:hypothetical protein